jgi:hypothetical protein
MQTAVPCLLLAFSANTWGYALSLTGHLDPNNPQDVFLYTFTLTESTPVSIQTWGYGGTATAPGGTNAQRAVVPPGGFDPYVSVFSGSGPGATFLASNDDGKCPPGATLTGHCQDATLTLVALPAGTYTLALSAFANMSFAENYGSGTLGDGFIGLGSFDTRTANFAVDIAFGTSPISQVPTLGRWHLMALTLTLALAAFVLFRTQPKVTPLEYGRIRNETRHDAIRPVRPAAHDGKWYCIYGIRTKSGVNARH